MSERISMSISCSIRVFWGCGIQGRLLHSLLGFQFFPEAGALARGRRVQFSSSGDAGGKEWSRFEGDFAFFSP